MKKLKILLVLLLILSGCKKKEEEKIDIHFFYLDTCVHCNAFKEIAKPALEEEFGDRLTFIEYDMDDYRTPAVYEMFTEKLEGYNETEQLVPFIVVDGYFALLMYNEGEEKLLIQDIKAAIKGEELSSYLSEGRWLFKEENNE